MFNYIVLIYFICIKIWLVRPTVLLCFMFVISFLLCLVGTAGWLHLQHHDRKKKQPLNHTYNKTVKWWSKKWLTWKRTEQANFCRFYKIWRWCNYIQITVSVGEVYRFCKSLTKAFTSGSLSWCNSYFFPPRLAIQGAPPWGPKHCYKPAGEGTQGLHSGSICQNNTVTTLGKMEFI